MIEKFGPIVLPVKVDKSSIINFQLVLYDINGKMYHVLQTGRSSSEDIVTLRVESACTFAHLYESQLCDCEKQLKYALRMIGSLGGILIYALDQHGRGVGLKDHVRVYQAEQSGLDTVEAHLSLGLKVDARQYDDIVLILEDLKIRRVKLLTNNPNRISFFREKLEYVERVPIEEGLNPYNVHELMIKKEKMGHLLSFKSDCEWLDEINSIETEQKYFFLVKNSILKIFHGTIGEIVSFIKNITPEKDSFFTLYHIQKKDSEGKLNSLLASLKEISIQSYHLRIIIKAELKEKERKKLIQNAYSIGISEFKVVE